MPYRFTVEDVAFLRSPAGEQALDAVARLALTPASMLADVADVRRHHPDHDAALIETVRCRRRAAGRLRNPQRLLASDDAVQQATASVVAAHRAADLAARHPGAVVHDVTCSIGAELVELAAAPGLGGVIGSDLDRVRLAMARHNTADPDIVAGAPPTLLVADALTPTSTADVVVADPARRTGGSRVFRLDQLTPPLPDVLTAYAGRPLVVKCAPGLDYRQLREQFGVVGEVHVTSLDSGVREACLWVGPGIGDGQRATVLRTTPDGSVWAEEITSAEPDDVGAAGDPGRWLIDPDGAVVRAGLVRHYAHRHHLWQLDPQIAYLTGDEIPLGARGFRILERLDSTGDKVLRKSVAAHDGGSLEILVRGLDVDPDALRKRLKPKGSRQLALVLTRIGRKGVAFVCEAGIRNDRFDGTAPQTD
ncbi:class I SAM-dependent methyltransferase [Gordonia sp. NB41Y]|uniref:THUMP-like domain-containing protein n=1 Tax=Gordonia sp. NB41Y TaxID=875808 RepID=UPI00273C14C0|nr:class I SAM-dependent methyltransferase [Gordonia sp. NB41Y]WLP93225.1 class I SAM-dependent methyltransferase [Gordonia sp. NB41Y]